jgi:hypothetical protein
LLGVTCNAQSPEKNPTFLCQIFLCVVCEEVGVDIYHVTDFLVTSHTHSVVIALYVPLVQNAEIFIFNLSRNSVAL